MSGTGPRWWRCWLCRPALHPDAYYQAASIDGVSKLGRLPLHPAAQDARRADDRRAAALHGQLHDLHRALRVTGGGPGNSTTFLSRPDDKKAVGQFDLGPAAAFSLIYFLIILLMCFIFYNWMQRVGTQTKEGGHDKPQVPEALAVPDRVHLCSCLLPIYWMVNMSFKTNNEILAASRCSRSTSPGTTTRPS
jgi:hypothetical protein